MKAEKKNLRHNSPFRIIPVIDLMQGIVVHALKGERKHYRPLSDSFPLSSNPVEVATNLCSRFGFTELYVADLDSITRRGSNLAVIREVLQVTGMSMMVDAGVDSPKLAEMLLEGGVSKVIVGTETLKEIESLVNIVEACGGERVVVSMDFAEDMLLTMSEALKCISVDAAAKRFQALGVGEIIVIDLAKVGTGLGVNIALAQRVIDSLEIPVIVGGGIRDSKDLLVLKRGGAAGALVSTSLHTGEISKEDVDEFCQ